jgi:acetyl-CoA C-acetyltransferase
MIARAVGAAGARTVIGRVGVLQQTLIGTACRRIAEGEDEVALVVGGEAGYRILRSAILGVPVADRADHGQPDEVLAPHEALRAPAELAVGLTMPVGLYAILESALLAEGQLGLDAHRDRIADLYARFSRVAADNPHAWTRTAFQPGEIRDASPKNAMQAFPYTKRHCSSWSIDQASALLLTTAERAAEAGVPRETWIFPLASAESNHMQTVSSRRELHRSAGARLAGRAALDASGLAAEDIDFLDLYSCFPSAVQICAKELGIPLDRQLTITGGMAFAGGPYNNYVLHSTAQMGLLLRRHPGSTGLVGCISGIATKQAFCVWAQQPGAAPFAFRDVTDAVARAESPLAVEAGFSGQGTVAGYTVLHGKDAPPRGIVLADIGPGRRTVACTDDERLTTIMQGRDLVGSSVVIEDGVVAMGSWGGERAREGVSLTS